MKIICFIGSGFNYLQADIAKAQQVFTKENFPLHEKLSSLNRLWDQFVPLLSPFSDFIPTTNGEELIGALEGIESVYRRFDVNEATSSLNTIALLNHLIKKEMQKLGEKFIEFEEEGGYSDVYNAFPNFGKSFNQLLKDHNVDTFYLCTTNYDGIIDCLLTYYCEKDTKRKFILKDGFIHGNFNPKLFRSYPFKIAHLHGSYKYIKGIAGTRKLDKGIVNTNPVMIYNSPNRKEADIKEDSVLSAYFLELENQLKLCDKVISIGNSFKAEPHLKQLLKDHFNRPNTEMIVCSNKPDEVVSVLEPYYSLPIYTQTTEHIKSEEQLIKIFNRLMGSKRAKILATA